MINSSDESAGEKITHLIRYYQTKELVVKPVKNDTIKYTITNDPSGYYTIIDSKIDKIDLLNG